MDHNNSNYYNNNQQQQQHSSLDNNSNKTNHQSKNDGPIDSKKNSGTTNTTEKTFSNIDYNDDLSTSQLQQQFQQLQNQFQQQEPKSIITDIDIDTSDSSLTSKQNNSEDKDFNINTLLSIPLSTDNQSNSNKLSDNTKELLQLRGFCDRMNSLDDKNNNMKQWFPFTYEVVIYQWLALLLEQSKSNNPANSNKEGDGYTSTQQPPSFVTRSLSEAGARSKGITIGCAPILFEIIKKSLGNRIFKLTKHNKQIQKFLEKHHNTRSSSSSPKNEPSSYAAFNNQPCFTLDANIIETLERLITIITDACIDSRNFDTRVFRQSSIDVNDSIVRFIRDLFGYLDLDTVHRLLMVYFSRFVTTEGKVWQDRDSRLGVRVSW